MFNLNALKKISLSLILVFWLVPFSAFPLFAEEDEDLDQSTKDRKQQEKEQKKKDKKFNEEKVYRFMVDRSVLTLPLFMISLYVQGQLVEGKLRVAIQTKNSAARKLLDNEKLTIKGIVYPLALRMWEDGRPTNEDIRNFKIDCKSQLQQRYDELIQDVFIESIL